MSAAHLHKGLTLLYKESPLRIVSGSSQALGIISAPQAPQAPSDTAVVLVTGGAQYRAGSHRQAVRLARRLAQSGFPVLRFDLSGLGDAIGALHSFEDITPQISAAIESLQAHTPQVRRIVLWGLCDGASAALLYWHHTQDSRLAGLCLVNPWVRSEVSLARTHIKHYYRQRLTERAFWQKLLRGGVGAKAARDLLASVTTLWRGKPPPNTFQQQMAQGWRSFAGPILLLISEQDLTGQEFLEHAAQDTAWSDCLNMPALEQHVMAGTDHTCSTPGGHEQLEHLTHQWLRRHFCA